MIDKLTRISPWVAIAIGLLNVMAMIFMYRQVLDMNDKTTQITFLMATVMAFLYLGGVVVNLPV
jgi:hypothetical protein